MKQIFLRTTSLFLIGIFLVVPSLVQARPEYNAPYRNDVGLNVHWALGGFNRDALYAERIEESNTYWVREHFSMNVLGLENPDAWFARYDDVMNYYRARNIKVVGMLAYGLDDKQYSVPDMDAWLTVVERVVVRYSDVVEVWEVWNEPDSPDYLSHNSPEEYVGILKPAYERIKAVSPNSKVMAGALSYPNVDFARSIFEQAYGYFDLFSVHYYYGEKYVADGKNLKRLERDAKALRELVSSYDPLMGIWVTEIGFSTGSPGVFEEIQKEYLDAASTVLIQKGYASRLFVYNIKNYDYNTEYENNFGLLDNELTPRKAWSWYTGIVRGPYDKNRLPFTDEQRKAEELKVELERYFGTGLIPISAENWATVVQSYVYGGYSVRDIVQAIRFGGKTVHPKIQKKFWEQTEEYQTFIDKDWTGGLIMFAYEQPRIKVADEGKKAQELSQALHEHHNFSTLEITPEVWGDLVRAYVYGGYPVSAIARAVKSNWKTVSKTEPFDVWQKSYLYQEGIQIVL